MAADDAHPLARLPRLWALYARMDLLFIARGMKTAFSWYFADLLLALGSAAWAFLLAARFDGIGVWSKQQVAFLLGLALFVRGVIDFALNANIYSPSRRIGRGQLDHMLLMPQPLWVTIASDGFMPFSCSGTLLAGAAVIAWSVQALALPISAGWLALLALHVLSAGVIMLSFAYLWGSLAFFAPRGAEEINTTTTRLIEQLKPFPLDGVGGGLSLLLLSVVPAGFLAWLPSRVLIGLSDSSWALVATPLAALVAALLAIAVFRLGLRHYGRTGSTRYLAHGHRR
ncbi:MAG: ABC-2 family transporter protein [Myxococcota bacterium]